MKNEDVIKYFLVGKVAVSSNCNLTSTGEKLFSYQTCIAQHYNGEIIVNTAKYSTTTSHHQNLLIRTAFKKRDLISISKVTNSKGEEIKIPRGQRDLLSCLTGEQPITM